MQHRVPVVTKQQVAVLCGGFLLLVLLSLAQSSSRPLVSAEVGFTDADAHGLSIVPASCPSSPHYIGECSGGPGGPGGPGGNGGSVGSGGSSVQNCVPHAFCSGKDVLNSCTGALIQHCTYGCTAGGCVATPSPSFESFTATFPPDGANPNGGTFAATGHLQAHPTLLRSGDHTQLYWNVSNVSSCTVTGANNDSFTAASSGTSGKTSGSIVAKTIYTLHCTSLPGATPAEVTETVTISVVPSYQEI